MRNSNGEGTIVKLPGKRRKNIAVRSHAIKIDGKFRTIYIGYFDSIGSAKDCLKMYNTDINFRNSIINKLLEKYSELEKNIDNSNNNQVINFEENVINPEIDNTSTVAKMYETLVMIRKKDISSSTLENYKTSFKNISELHDKVFSMLSFDELNNYLNEPKFTYNTALKARSLLSLLYDLAIAQNIVKRNYAMFIKIKKENYENTNSRNIKIFTNDEINLLWEKKRNLSIC